MLDYRVRFVLCVLGLLALLFVGMACNASNDRGVCAPGGSGCAPLPVGTWGLLPVVGRRMGPRGRMFLLLLLAIAFMGMACTPDPSVPNFNPNPAGDLLGISDILGDVTEHATGK